MVEMRPQLQTVFEPILGLSSEMPFRIRDIEAFTPIGSDHESFTAAGVPGFFVIEAVSEDIHAQFVAVGGRFYGAYVGLKDRTGLITHTRIAEFEAAHPDAVELAWYPDSPEGAAL